MHYCKRDIFLRKQYSRQRMTGKYIKIRMKILGLGNQEDTNGTL